MRALVVTDAAGRVMCRSLIRLVLRSDTFTPVVFCDPMFFTTGYSRELQLQLLLQAKELEAHMGIPVVHAGSVLPTLDGGGTTDAGAQDGDSEVGGAAGDAAAAGAEAAGDRASGGSDYFVEGGYVRRVSELDYEIVWVDLLEMDGVAPYTYSEELPYDELLQQHAPGVQASVRPRSSRHALTL